MNIPGRLASLFILNVALSHLFIINTNAQQVDISSSLNPVGSGARAMGMGGAFISVADDATAASWNPAGLVQIEKPEVSAVYSYFYRQQEYSSPAHPEIATENTMDAASLNYASLAFPFSMFKRNMIVSLNYQRLLEMNKEVSFTLDREVLGTVLTEDIEFSQDGFLYAMSPAYAVQITPQLSIGGALNFWDNALGKNGWESTYDSVLTGSVMGTPIDIQFSQRDDVSFEGFNAHAGFLWHISGPWTLGGVYKTAFDADIEKKSSFVQTPNSPASRTDSFVMRMPSSYGLGIAYRHSDNWTAALDVYRTEWSRFVLRDEAGNEMNPLDGAPISDGRLKDTIQVRLGAEYLFIRSYDLIPLRAGLFYDPEPAKGHLDKFYGFSLGTGYARDKMAFDISYQFRTGNNVTGDVPSVEGSNADIDQHAVMVSMIYYLGN